MPSVASASSAAIPVAGRAADEFARQDVAAVDALDPLVVNPGRLSILLALADSAADHSGDPDDGGRSDGNGSVNDAGNGAVDPDHVAAAAAAFGVEFVHLRRRTRLTDGNLACHARRLADGGMIDVAKRFRGGKPVTAYRLTDIGRRALAAHVRTLVAAVGPAGAAHADEPPVPTTEPRPPTSWADAGGADDDDWVD